MGVLGFILTDFLRVNRKIPKQPLKIFNPMMEASLATVNINDGEREAMKDKSTRQEYKGQARTNNNTTSQLTGTFHQGTSTYFTENTYFPVSKRQGDKWQAQRSQRKCVMILRIKFSLIPQSLV